MPEIFCYSNFFGNFVLFQQFIQNSKSFKSNNFFFTFIAFYMKNVKFLYKIWQKTSRNFGNFKLNSVKISGKFPNNSKNLNFTEFYLLPLLYFAQQLK
jgi:hypothetical protein